MYLIRFSVFHLFCGSCRSLSPAVAAPAGIQTRTFAFNHDFERFIDVKALFGKDCGKIALDRDRWFFGVPAPGFVNCRPGTRTRTLDGRWSSERRCLRRIIQRQGWGKITIFWVKDQDQFIDLDLYCDLDHFQNRDLDLDLFKIDLILRSILDPFPVVILILIFSSLSTF